MAKQEIDIEKLLRWAYRDELPKGYRDGRSGVIAAISPMFRFANLGGPVDNWSREPGFPVAMGVEPHEDAKEVHAAAISLDDATIRWPGAAVLLGDLAQFVTDEELSIVRSMRAHAAGLVTLHARMGNRPIWQVDYTIARVVGRDRKSPLRKGRGRRHAKNTQGVLRIDPMASEILSARFDYFVWHSALCELARDLDLKDHAPVPPAAPQAPWFNDTEPRVFSDVTDMDARALASGRVYAVPKLPLKPARPLTLQPLTSEIERERKRRRKKRLTNPEGVA